MSIRYLIRHDGNGPTNQANRRLARRRLCSNPPSDANALARRDIGRVTLIDAINLSPLNFDPNFQQLLIPYFGTLTTAGVTDSFSGIRTWDGHAHTDLIKDFRVLNHGGGGNEIEALFIGNGLWYEMRVAQYQGPEIVPVIGWIADANESPDPFDPIPTDLFLYAQAGPWLPWLEPHSSQRFLSRPNVENNRHSVAIYIQAPDIEVDPLRLDRPPALCYGAKSEANYVWALPLVGTGLLGPTWRGDATLMGPEYYDGTRLQPAGGFYRLWYRWRYEAGSWVHDASHFWWPVPRAQDSLMDSSFTGLPVITHQPCAADGTRLVGEWIPEPVPYVRIEFMEYEFLPSAWWFVWPAKISSIIAFFGGGTPAGDYYVYWMPAPEPAYIAPCEYDLLDEDDEIIGEDPSRGPSQTEGYYAPILEHNQLSDATGWSVLGVITIPPSSPDVYFLVNTEAAGASPPAPDAGPIVVRTVFENGPTNMTIYCEPTCLPFPVRQRTGGLIPGWDLSGL